MEIRLPSMLLKVLILLTIVQYAHGSSCRPVTSVIELEHLSNSAVDYSIVLVCPFKFIDGSMEDTISIRSPHVTVVCFKENPGDSCEIVSAKRHLNIFGDKVTLVGFDFIDAKDGGLVVRGAGATFIDCNFIGNHKDDGRGGAIEFYDSKNSLVMTSVFRNNMAENGGAIYAGVSPSNTNKLNHTVTLVRSDFVNNTAVFGGAIGLNLGATLLYNNFINNKAGIWGSSVLSFSSAVCAEGGNYACSGALFTETTCDGILYRTSQGGYVHNSCETFSDICDYPSGSPSISLNPSTMPSVTPTILPSSKPSLLPSISPSATPSTSPPTSLPSFEPSFLPSGKPSHVPSATPSFLPSQSMSPSQYPSSEPSEFPSPIPTGSPSTIPSFHPSMTHSAIPSMSPSGVPTISRSPSSSPSSLPSVEPSVSMSPTEGCNMPKTTRSSLITQQIQAEVSNFQQETPVQNVALEWIRDIDRRYICPFEEDFIPRYAAAAVVMALDDVSLLWPRDECDWQGFQCNTDGQIIEIALDEMAGEQLRPEISLLPQLNSISITDSSITNIPPSILQLQELRRLDLDKNNINGPFPFSNSTTMLEMMHLDIASNSLTGNIEFLTMFPNLEEAHLENNAFNGTIPASLGELTDLRHLILYGNSFHGIMPASVCNLRSRHIGSLQTLGADCGGSQPKVVCSCCTHCL